jgi:hypothetical protein
MIEHLSISHKTILSYSFSFPNRYVFTDFYNSRTGLSQTKWNVFGNVQPENFDPLAFSKSVGDYPPGGTSAGSKVAQWGKDQNFVFYG